MTRLVFRNYDKKQIKKLLQDLGKERYEAALQDEGITQKPLGMNGFFVEFDTKTKNIDLYHRYPSGITVKILDVLAFWTLPIEGWKMERIPT